MAISHRDYLTQSTWLVSYISRWVVCCQIIQSEQKYKEEKEIDLYQITDQENN